MKLAAIPLIGTALLVAAAVTRADPPERNEPPSQVSDPVVPEPIADAAAEQDALRYLEQALASPDLSPEDRESCLRLIPAIRAEIDRRSP